jgi:hypothetical protein
MHGSVAFTAWSREGHTRPETEDRGNAAFYRFLPTRRPRGVGDLATHGGTLQALVVSGRPNLDMNTVDPGQSFDVEWVTIEEPNPPKDTVRTEAQAKGAAIFDRTEGLWSSRSRLYFDCTTGGEAQLGQLFEYTPRGKDGGKLKLIFESTNKDVLESPDNLVLVPRTGHVLLQEDSDGEQFVRGVTLQGELYDFARTVLNMSDSAEARSARMGAPSSSTSRATGRTRKGIRPRIRGRPAKGSPTPCGDRSAATTTTATTTTDQES